MESVLTGLGLLSRTSGEIRYNSPEVRGIEADLICPFLNLESLQCYLYYEEWKIFFGAMTLIQTGVMSVSVPLGVNSVRSRLMPWYEWR